MILQILLLSVPAIESFTVQVPHLSRHRAASSELYSFYSDSSDYKSSDSDFTSDDDASSEVGIPILSESEEDAPTIEETPVPMSKNAGSRFVAFVFDKTLYNGEEEMDVLDLHEERINLTEKHIMFCRKANLYNETFNTESMADILWSNQM